MKINIGSINPKKVEENFAQQVSIAFGFGIGMGNSQSSSSSSKAASQLADAGVKALNAPEADDRQLASSSLDISKQQQQLQTSPAARSTWTPSSPRAVGDDMVADDRRQWTGSKKLTATTTGRSQDEHRN